MPNIITESEIKRAINEETFIKNGNVNNAEGIKYDFCLGEYLLKSDFGQPIDMSKLPEERKAQLFIEPGEVVFVLSKEKLILPKDINAFLSPKRKLSHDGILVLGGFCIDPLYQGKLLVGLYNFSSSPFPLKPGKKLIAAIFYRLNPDEIDEFKTPEISVEDFPDDLIRLMKKYKPISTQSLMSEISTMKDKIDNLRQEFNDMDIWFKKFQESLESQEKSIEKLTSVLDNEIEKRREGERYLIEQMSKHSREAYKTAAIVGVIGALLISVLMKFLLG